MLPLYILNNERHYTLPLGVQAFASQYSVGHREGARVHLVVDDPRAGVLHLIFEKRIVGGLTGAVKG